jgi:hypothetical protein
MSQPRLLATPRSLATPTAWLSLALSRRYAEALALGPKPGVLFFVVQGLAAVVVALSSSKASNVLGLVGYACRRSRRNLPIAPFALGAPGSRAVTSMKPRSSGCAWFLAGGKQTGWALSRASTSERLSSAMDDLPRAR